VIIELGGNDGLRGYPITLMKKNLQQMIDLSQSSNADVLLAGIEIPPNYGVRYTTLFRGAFQQLAATNRDIQYEPFILDAVATKPELMQDDGIHPTAAAQPQLLTNIWDNLYPLLIPPQ
jgi:acyl-CoA thioesterase-1